jgi:uncharacterized protein YeaO (DUF488 family)
MSTGLPHITVSRVFDPRAGLGTRVLVDRIWPRGLRKDEARLDEWCTDVAPSTELRRWYGHDPEHFEEFARRYRAELSQPLRAAAIEHLREVAETGPVILLTATKSVNISHAAVLANLLRGPPR